MHGADVFWGFFHFLYGFHDNRANLVFIGFNAVDAALDVCRIGLLGFFVDLEDLIGAGSEDSADYKRTEFLLSSAPTKAGIGATKKTFASFCRS